uniref:Uncharacterized protein n=1 Tax=Oryza meridionalis TaxID=40149 RepID=A0A0E0DNN4_9ORYZ
MRRSEHQVPPPPSPPTGHLAVECLFAILRRLLGGCERGASTCISRRWFIMEDDELSANWIAGILTG